MITTVREAMELPDAAVLVPLVIGSAALQRTDGLWLEVGELEPVTLRQSEHLPALVFNVPDDAVDQAPQEQVARVVFTETTRYVLHLRAGAVLDLLAESGKGAEELTADDLNDSDAIDELLHEYATPDFFDGASRDVTSITFIDAD